MPLIDGADDLARLLDDHQQAHRFVDLDHLQRQAGPQIRTAALHDAEQPGEIVHHLAAAAVAFVVDRREVVLEVDAGADRRGGEQRRLEDAAVAVGQRIIGNQEGAAIEKPAAAHAAATDESGRDRRVTELRASLRQVVAAVREVLPRLLRRRAGGRRGEAAAALDGVQPGGFVAVAAQAGEGDLLLGGERLVCVPLEALVAGIVLGGDEAAVVGDHDPLLRQPPPHLRSVGERGEDACVRAAVPAGAGATVVGAEMRVVATVRTVADDHQQRRKALGEADAAQEAGNARHLLVLAETLSRVFGAGAAARFVAVGRQLQCARQRLVEGLAATLEQAAEAAGREAAGEQCEQCRRRGDGSQQRRQQAAAAARLVQPLLPAQAQPAPPQVLPVCHLGCRRDALAHRVRRPDDDRAEGRRSIVIDPLPEHRYAEETGGTEGFVGRIDLLEVAAGSLLTIVHAEDELCRRLRHARRRATAVRRQGSEDPLPVVMLVGQQPGQAAFGLGQRGGTGEQGLRASRAEFAQLAGAETEVLGEDEQRPGRAGVLFAGRAVGGRRGHGGGQLRPAPGVVGNRCQQQRPQAGQQLIRQAAFTMGVPQLQFLRVLDEMGGERLELHRQSPDPAQQLLAVKAIEDQSHGQQLAQADRWRARLWATLAPVEHARPARQLHRQSLQVAAPAAGVDAETLQFVGDRLQRVVGQQPDPLPGAGELFQFPGPVTAGAGSPGNVEALHAQRVLPGGEALVEMRGEMADQHRLQDLAGILAAEVGQQLAKRPVVAEPVVQLLPQ